MLYLLKFSFLCFTSSFLKLKFPKCMPEICMYNNFKMSMNMMVSKQDNLEILSVCWDNSYGNLYWFLCYFNDYIEMLLTTLIKLDSSKQQLFCVVINVVLKVIPIRFLVMLMVLFMKLSVLFQRVKGLEKEWIKSVLESSTDYLHCETTIRNCWFLLVFSNV